jgi:hypothetical protein
MGFLTRLRVELVAHRTWRLTSSLQYRCPDGSIIHVPRNFVTDFASVPRIPVAWLLTGDTGHRAAVIHDWLYRSHERSRAEADKLFYRILREDGEPLWRAVIMYAAVRLFGGAAYHRHDVAHKEAAR